MAKSALVIALLGALLVAASASAAYGSGRELLQANKFNCAQAKALDGKCEQLMSCIKSKPGGAMLTSGALKDLVLRECKNCAAATKSCKAGAALPGQCARGLAFKPVTDCINDFQKANAPKPAPKAAPKPVPKQG